MNLQFDIQQIRTQKLIMTPELRTAIALLQYSSLELAQYLYQQASENPLIEIKETDTVAEDSVEDLTQKNDGAAELDWHAYVRQHFQHRGGEATIFRQSENPIDNVAGARQPTLEQYLSEQLNLSHVDREEKRIAAFLIGNLNENGYLEISANEAAQMLGIEPDRTAKALRLVQSLDPAGVGAHSLSECLTLQLQRAGEGDPLAYEIVRNHIEDLAYHRYQKVAQQLRVNAQQVKCCFEKIRSLDPKPGSRFSQSAPHFITPDVIVEQNKGKYVVMLNDRVTPRLSINQYYEKLLNDAEESSEVKHFIYDKLNAALWLIRSLDQRNSTLYKVTEAIMQKQSGFLEYGVSRLQTLTLKQIAEMLDVHESTVSRVTNNKYVQTPKGLYELKFFFTSGVSDLDENLVSSQSVKMKIKAIIDREDKTHPLSDQEIAQQLYEDGVLISRRTVAKYREKIRIPSSSKRKSAG